MDKTNSDEQKVNVDFESHPPIEDDLDGIAALLRQTLLHFADCNSLARYLIQLKDITQVIALDEPDEEDDDEEEPDSDIYGVSSVIELPSEASQGDFAEARNEIKKFIEDKCPEFKQLLTDEHKIGLVVNERYINLPPQLSLPTFKSLQQHLTGYTNLVFVTKVLLRTRNSDTKLSSKKSKQSNESNEPIIFVNAEEEILSENCEFYSDVDVSAYCDENATWSKNDSKYIPHRRIIVVDFKKWPKIMQILEKELI